MRDTRFDDIRARLEVIADELADLSMEHLRRSIDEGGDQLPLDEKRLSRARRAVLKAADTLRSDSDANHGETW